MDGFRNDIQGLRGGAILGVLFFHTKPVILHNGYLGVDMFFVISGYLMHSIVSREPELSREVLASFVLRRFHRIVPLFAVVLFLVAVTSSALTAPTDVELLSSQILWALPFLTNVKQLLNRRDYWWDSAERPFLLHTWSLGVEMQFYLLVIPISLILRRCSHPKAVLEALIAASLFFYMRSIVARFNFVLCRLWQFLLGALSCEMHGTHQKSFVMKVLSNICSLAVAVILLFPRELQRRQSACFVTFATAVILCNPGLSAFILENAVLQFLGRISYSLYLVHWPVICLVEYWDDNKSNTVALSLLISLVLSVLVHYAVEKPLLASTTQRSGLIVGAVYAVLACAAISGCLISTSSWIRPVPAETKKLIASVRFNSSPPFPLADKDHEAERWTGQQTNAYSGVYKSSGSLNVLLIGNSFAYRASVLIKDALRGNYSTYRVFVELGCRILSRDHCPHFTVAYQEVVRRMRPNLLLLIDRDPGMLLGGSEVEEYATKVTAFLSSYADLVVIDAQLPFIEMRRSPHVSIVRKLSMNWTDWSDMQMQMVDMEAGRRAEMAVYGQITEQNVVVNDVARQLCEADVCLQYNKTTLRPFYTDSSGHLSQPGLDRLRRGYEHFINRGYESGISFYVAFGPLI